MPCGRTLLERLAVPDAPDERHIEVDPGQLRESIRHHLQQLLNSRPGSSPSAPDYGTPEFDDLFRGGRTADKLFGAKIAACIEKYEPRLKDVRVRFIVDESEPLRLRFDIEALMVSETDSLPTVYSSMVETSGRVIVGRSPQRG
jgi:type VI secretion system protein